MGRIAGMAYGQAGAAWGSIILTYTYDVDGTRTVKRVGDVSHTYIWEDGKPLQEWVSGNTDVHSAGATVASYEYDPFGNIITATGAMAEANPLRYRSYYYDRETGFYYLNSRYYDPKIGRFINADSYVSTGQGIVGYNMFAYCGNNPVIREDAAGGFWDTVFDLLSLGASIVDVFTDPTDGWAWAGLGGDLIDQLPFVTGIGEGTKAVGVANKIDNGYDAAKGAKSGSKTVDDMIDNLPETTNGKGIARNFESSGGFEQTIKDFESLDLTDVKEITTQYGTGKVGKLGNGITVIARPGSTTGGATLEIRISNSKVYKIRY